MCIYIMGIYRNEGFTHPAGEAGHCPDSQRSVARARRWSSGVRRPIAPWQTDNGVPQIIPKKIMVVRQCHKPPHFWWFILMVMTGMVYDCFNHIEPCRYWSQLFLGSPIEHPFCNHVESLKILKLLVSSSVCQRLSTSHNAFPGAVYRFRPPLDSWANPRCWWFPGPW